MTCFFQFPHLKNYKLFRRETEAYSWKLHVITVFSRRRKCHFKRQLLKIRVSSIVDCTFVKVARSIMVIVCSLRYVLLFVSGFPCASARSIGAYRSHGSRYVTFVTIVMRARARARLSRRSPFSLFRSRGPVVAWQTLCTNHFLRAHLCHIACIRADRKVTGSKKWWRVTRVNLVTMIDTI